MSVVFGGARAVSPFRVLKLKGLDPGARYQVDGAGCWGGDALMHAGFPLPAVKGDYQAVQLHLTAVDDQLPLCNCVLIESGSINI